MQKRLTLPPIASDAHKYTRGSLLVLAGSRRYFGAGVLTTRAAEVCGVGYVSLATPEAAAAPARMHLLCSPVIEASEAGKSGSFSAKALQAITSELHHIDALCCGPGLTITDDTSAFVETVLTYSAAHGTPLLLDADALNTIALKPQLMKARQAQHSEDESLFVQHSEDEVRPSKQSSLILTPHAGELARLHAAFIDREGVENETSVPKRAQALSQKLDAVVVAKGPTTFTAFAGEVFESNEATPALAKSGTGDVLAGVIASLLAQGMTAIDAALLGVQIHSRAGRHAEQARGLRSVTALDVIESIPAVLRKFE